MAARDRRAELRQALQRIIKRAQAEHADLITCGGDLFEQEHITRDTANFVMETLGAAGIPVLIAPGHADPAVPSSPYRYLRWPKNVTIAAHEELRPYQFGEVQVWAAGFMRPDVPEAPLRDFPRPEVGRHFLLLHASDMSHVPEGVTPYKPILPAQIEDAGFQHALLGHYHAAESQGRITYPGSPEPLGWHEEGRHCTALLTADDGNDLQVVLEDVNKRQYVEEMIDVTGMSSVDELRSVVSEIRQRSQLEGGVIRATLTGERSRALRFDPETLSDECQDGFAYLEFRDRSRLSHDVDAMAQEFTSRGEMVRKLVDQQGGPKDDHHAAGRALQLALDAFEE
jgi:DNA repair exonuclease SbcCD nuclease subunit